MAEMTASCSRPRASPSTSAPAWARRRCARPRKPARSTSTGNTPAPRSSTSTRSTDKLDAGATYAKVKELDAAKGLVWLNPSKANNTYALAMRAEDAAKKGIKSLSDLAAKEKGGAEAEVRLQRRVLRARRRAEAAPGSLRLRVPARERDAHGHRPRLPGAARRAGRRRPRVRDRRAHAGLQLRHPAGRQGLLPELRHDAGGPQGGPRQEPEARRGPERAVGQARRRHHGEAQRLGRRRQEERRGGRGRTS